MEIQPRLINAPNVPLGNTMLLVNAISFGAYLVLVKPLTKKYKTITLMKWMFLIGIFYTSPVTYKEFIEVSWFKLPFDAVLK